MLAGAHKKFYRIQHPEIYLLDLKVQYKHKMRLPLDVNVLPCLHSYCHNCIAKLDMTGSILTCPECRTTVEVRILLMTRL